MRPCSFFRKVEDKKCDRSAEPQLYPRWPLLPEGAEILPLFWVMSGVVQHQLLFRSRCWAASKDTSHLLGSRITSSVFWLAYWCCWLFVLRNSSSSTLSLSSQFKFVNSVFPVSKILPLVKFYCPASWSAESRCKRLQVWSPSGAATQRWKSA